MIESSAAWLLTYLVHSTIALGIAWGLSRFWLARQERWQEPLWRGALLAGVISATLSTMLPDLLFGATVLGVVNGGDESRASTVLAIGGATWVASAAQALVILWLTVGLVRVGTLLRAHLSIRRMLAERIDLDRRMLTGELAFAPGDRPLRISVSNAIATPMVFGFNEVVLPMRALHDLTQRELDAVLAHEIAHVERDDTTWLWISMLIERALWLQPLNRVAGSRLRVLAEYSCDDSALRVTRSPDSLAAALAQVSGWLETGPVAASMVGMATVESVAVGRIRRILDTNVVPASTPRPLVARTAATLAIAALVVVAPGFRPPADAGFTHTISAFDDAGPFTITLAGSRVVAATVDSDAVASHQIRQNGRQVRIDGDPTAGPLELTLTPDGGFRWTSRRRPAPR